MLSSHQHLDSSGSEIPSANHVEYSAGRSGDDVLSVIELPDVFADICAADACVTLNRHVIAQSQDHLINETYEIGSTEVN